MKTSIETRDAFTLKSADGLQVRGTYHKPCDPKSGLRLDGYARDNIGVLFVSSGVHPRAATGDSAVHWAESLAKEGYPSFRVDLPGLGDSDGDLSPKEIDFDALVNDGSFAPIVSDIVNQLAERFKLRGLVAIGNCSGAVTALYSSAVNKRILGLILLDPYFHLLQTTETQSVLVRSQLRFVKALLPEQPGQSVVRDGVVKVLRLVRKVYLRLTPLRGVVGSKQLPATANLPLVRCWKQAASGGLPVLVLRSPFATPKLGEYDYVRDLHPLSDTNCRVSVKLIDGANHAFSERPIRAAVQRYSERWLDREFFSQEGRHDSESRAMLDIPPQPHSGILTMSVRSEVIAQFEQVAKEQCKPLAPLADNLMLLESGLDSLCFAIIVARLEDTLGVDPLSASEDARFPVTLGDFVRFYENAAA